jgi:hypothetical protein
MSSELSEAVNTSVALSFVGLTMANEENAAAQLASADCIEAVGRAISFHDGDMAKKVFCAC